MKKIVKFLGVVTLAFLGSIIVLSIISPELYNLDNYDDFDEDYHYGEDENDSLL